MNSSDFWWWQLDTTRDKLSWPLLDLFYTVCGDAYGYGKAWLLINTYAPTSRELHKFLNAYKNLTYEERKNLAD